MTAPVTDTAGLYRIELTREQWEALSNVVSYAQTALVTDIRDCEKSEAFWLEQGDDGERLALSRNNLAVRRQWLTEAQSVAPVVYGATVVSTRKRSTLISS